MTCPYCGTPEPARAQRFGLTVEANPAAVYWRGKRVTSFTPVQARFLMMFVRCGRVSSLGLLCLVGENTTAETTKVHISKIRKALREADIPLSIQNLFGWGYELVATDR